MTPEERESLEQERVWHLKIAESHAKRLTEDEEQTWLAKALENIVTIGDSVIKGGPFTHVSLQAVRGNIYDALKAWQPSLGTRTKEDDDLRTFYPITSMTDREIIQAANALYKAVKASQRKEQSLLEVSHALESGKITVNAPAATADSGGATVANVPRKAAGDRRSRERRQDGSHNEGYYRRALPREGRRYGSGDRRVSPHRRQSAHGSHPATWPMPERWPHRRQTREDRRRWRAGE